MMKTRIYGCEVDELLYEGASSIVYRGRREADGLPVVLKVLKDEHPAPGWIAALRHEHAILHSLDVDGVIRTHGLEQKQGVWALVLEDFGATSVRELGLAGTLSMEAFLELALAVAGILASVHQQRVIHKDINPSNLVMNPDDRQIKLIDFGIAMILPQETESFGSPGVLEGSLAYISPEQTGRMNRAIDYRTDYYSLGVTFYELLTGQCPFPSEDPLELVHCHIARQPSSPSEIDEGIPQPVADIVLKLMAKSADDRYQSAQGLRADLLHCLEQLRRNGAISRFPLARHDRSERFRLPQKLYGREQETERILAAFERANARNAILMMVSGYAGVGKSALIQEIYRPLTTQRGYFIAGKFDQYQRDVPYTALIQALRSLIAQVLTESEDRVSVWRERLLEALHGNVQILTSVCPELALIIPHQATMDTIPPGDARNRFHQSIRAIVSVFAAPEHPLCVFFDDLQWADADSLKLIEELMYAASTLPLFLIGAYRDNEVGSAHPLMLTLREIEEQGGHVEYLAVPPLGLECVKELVADTLSIEPEAGAPLADLLTARTAGNPFFLRTFLLSLYDDGAIFRTPDGWQWDMERIRQRGVTDNMITLMVDRIQRLPEATQEVLKLAACLGNQFELGMLAIVADRIDGSVGHDLWNAVVEGLVLVLDKVRSPMEMSHGGSRIRCQFAHDRIQQALISMIDAGSRAVLHCNVGRRLLHSSSPEDREERLFVIVGQLNQGRSILLEPEERVSLARLNLKAARKALKAAAAQPALGYAQTGISLLMEHDWEQHYELARDLHIKGAEAAYLVGNLEVLDVLARAMLAYARSTIEEVAIWKIQGKVHFDQHRLRDAIRTYTHALERLGFGLPEEPGPELRASEMGMTAHALGNLPIEDLLDLPECTDPAARAAMELLDLLIEPAYATTSELFSVVIARIVRLSLQYGNTPYSLFGYISYGVLLSYDREIDRAYRFGRVALRLADRFGDKGYLSRTYLFASHQLFHWKEPHYELSPALVDAYRYGMEAANPFHAAGSALTLCINRFLAGDELGKLIEDMSRYAQEIAHFRQKLVLSWHRIYQQAAINLHQDIAEPCKLVGEAYDEDKVTPVYLETSDASGLFNYHFCKTFVCYVLGDFEAAAASARANEKYISITITAFWAAPWMLLDSLSRLAVYEHASEDERMQIREVVAANQERLRQWLPHCPRSYEHKLRLIEAELARVLGRDEEARATFDRAVELARQSGYTHEEALTCELAARFHLDRGQGKLGRYYLRDAHHGYLRWGALNKVRALERRYPHLLPRVATGSLSGLTLATISAKDWDINALDLISVLNASQAISKEIELSGLLSRLLELVIETGGAEAGYLLRERNGQWVVEVQKHAGSDQLPALASIPMDELEARGYRGLPVAVIHYVARTQEIVALDDATASPQFRRDPYIARKQVRSVLCFPLTKQGGRLGILYLENNLIRGAFTPTRVQILQLLSAQAAISLENALLYETLEHKVEVRTQELKEKNGQLTSALKRLQETQDRMIIQDRLASLGALTAGIAHELRNPLNFVSNFAKLSRDRILELKGRLAGVDDVLQDEIAAYLKKTLSTLALNLDKITEHSQRIESIIRSMLEHSRSRAGEPREIDLNALVRDYASLAYHGLRSQDSAFDIAIDMDLDESLGKTRVVAQEIGRVLLNLIDNACYAANAKKQILTGESFAPRLQLRTRNLGDKVEIRVRDNGMGIPVEIRDKIFNPFFTTKQPGKGTGLGLSISHDVVVQGSGGTIDFETEEGEFTEFIVTLPRR